MVEKKWIVTLAKPLQAQMEAPDEGAAALKALEANPGYMVVDVQRVMEPGQRVRVMDGAQENELGFGTIVGRVTVWFAEVPGRGIVSRRDAEVELTPADVPEGAVIRKMDDNVKIQMDDGSVRYGCQVWWAPVDPDDDEPAEDPKVSA